MLKVEGENRIDIAIVVNDLAKRYQVSDKTALKWLCLAIQYQLVWDSITEQIDYLLKEDVVEAVRSGT